MIEEKKYAPVYIPTLNRYEHFKRCLESLERCTDADKTDVYVGLDYPPSEKYVAGWKKIDEYLKEKEKKQAAATTKRAVKSVGNSAAGTIGRELGKEVGKNFGSFGKRLGGNVGASLGRGLLSTLLKM